MEIAMSRELVREIAEHPQGMLARKQAKTHGEVGSGVTYCKFW